MCSRVLSDLNYITLQCFTYISLWGVAERWKTANNCINELIIEQSTNEIKQITHYTQQEQPDTGHIACLSQADTHSTYQDIILHTSHPFTSWFRQVTRHHSDSHLPAQPRLCHPRGDTFSLATPGKHASQIARVRTKALYITHLCVALVLSHYLIVTSLIHHTWRLDVNGKSIVCQTWG